MCYSCLRGKLVFLPFFLGNFGLPFLKKELGVSGWGKNTRVEIGMALTYARYGRHGCGAVGGGGGAPSELRVGGCYPFYGGRALRERAGWQEVTVTSGGASGTRRPGGGTRGTSGTSTGNTTGSSGGTDGGGSTGGGPFGSVNGFFGDIGSRHGGMI